MKFLQSKSSGAQERTRFGMFGGVFTPSVLTILGIILFLRTGYVVGLVGTAQALLIILAANVISVLTSLSLAVISTQMRVKGGGFYYVISRTLGVEFGAALGLTLFLSISIGIAFYAIGLAEIVVQMAGLEEGSGWARWIAAAVIVLLFATAWIGADWATKLQYGVMACVAAALIAFFAGAFAAFDTDTMARNWSGGGPGGGFWFAFALFFPAITGFTQGLNMSGDLKDPKRAIPLGTFLAVGISAAVYLAAAFLLGATADGEALRGDYFVMEKVAFLGWLIPVGVIAATASSGLASILGAPRVLQALALDRVFPVLNRFGEGRGADNNPRRAVVLSAAIALGAALLGDLNFLAPIITMFFLASYGLLNYATFYVSDAASPSFRPTFKFSHKYASLAGAIACVGAMLAINPFASLVAAAVIFGVYHYVKRTAVSTRWSDAKRAYRFQRVRELLFEIDTIEEQPRDWRPQILVFSKDAESRGQLLCFASWIEGNSGLTSVVQILTESDENPKDRATALAEFERSIEESDVEAFPLAVEAPDFSSGFRMLLQAYGVGPLKANTILINWVDSTLWRRPGDASTTYGAHVEQAVRGGYNVVIWAGDANAYAAASDEKSANKRIDIWWLGDDSSELALILGYLMTRTDIWEDAELRVLAQGKSGKRKRTESDLRDFLELVQIEATVETLKTVTLETIAEACSRSTLVFLPIGVAEGKPQAAFDIDLDDFVARIPRGVFVIAGGDIELDPDPDPDSDLDDSDPDHEEESEEKKPDAAS